MYLSSQHRDGAVNRHSLQVCPAKKASTCQAIPTHQAHCSIAVVLNMLPCAPLKKESRRGVRSGDYGRPIHVYLQRNVNVGGFKATLYSRKFLRWVQFRYFTTRGPENFISW
ncbi:hypothetical protein AVEN_98052-1 [Araneus ventricosus]|uniref:Uncharacterized protein n=1 Tax=Araneus ventricosus TaxID=182803 RepID=A0A4Y2P2T2_ARAVE|nr:hypothetical protein AVEN_98052-1 [Araneus ventricosus]